MTAWRRSEPETIRPFFGVNAAEKALSGAAFVRAPGEAPEAGPVVAIDDHAWEEIAPTLLPRVDVASLSGALGEHVDAFELALLVRDPTFKRRALLRRWPLAAGLPEEIEVERAWLAKYGHGREVHLTLAVCLARPLPPEPGLPSDRGSWICRKTFELRPHQIQSQFPIEELTEERARAFGVDPRALVFVDYVGDINAVDENGGPVACAYVNADVHRRLTSGARSDALLALLEAEIVAGVILSAAEDIRAADDVEHDGPLDRILRGLSGDEPMSLEELKSMLDHGQAHQLVRGAVQAATEASLALSKA